MNGKSAIRWVRQNAVNLGIDSNRIAASGGSLGAHIAALAAASVDFDEPDEDKNISAKPNALVLWYPGLDTGPGSRLHEFYSERWQECSLLDKIDAGAPPTIIFHGSEDEFPVSDVEEYKRRMTVVGARCDIWIYNGQPHDFDHYRDGNNPYYYATRFRADEFLASLGYLDGEPTIENKEVEVKRQ
jgi:acetyl esterase/lipase